MPLAPSFASIDPVRDAVHELACVNSACALQLSNLVMTLTRNRTSPARMIDILSAELQLAHADWTRAECDHAGEALVDQVVRVVIQLEHCHRAVLAACPPVPVDSA